MAALIPGLGVPELLIIGAIILLLFGPKRLPQLAKSLGKSAKALRDGIDGKDEAAAEDEDVVTTGAPKKKAADTKAKSVSEDADEE